ncbi:MAG TPA: hypothetical protein VFZ89_13060 [Solirubrobacteraceae bacterium]
MDLYPPPLLYPRPPAEQLIVAVAVPIVFGVVTGLTLGWSEPVYLVLQLVGIAGGYLAGMEHDAPLEGVYRGLLGGLLFGSSILIAHGLADAAPKADLPEPETLLIAITAGFGTLLGWLGARRRARSG